MTVSLLSLLAGVNSLQDKLVAGSNIKTIGGQSPLGPGDLTVGNLILVPVAGVTQTAVAGNDYVTSNAAVTTFTGPAVATAGDRWAVTVTNGRIDNVINWNGLNHQGISDATMTMDIAKTWYFKYINATFGWKVD